MRSAADAAAIGGFGERQPLELPVHRGRRSASYSKPLGRGVAVPRLKPLGERECTRRCPWSGPRLNRGRRGRAALWA